MTKEQLAYLCKDTIESKDVSYRDKFDIRDIIMHVGFAYNDLLSAIIDKQRGVIDDGYLYVVPPIAIQVDTITGGKYIPLPYPVISLFRDRGVRMVAQTKGQNRPFRRMPDGQQEAWSRLEAGIGEKMWSMEGALRINVYNVPVGCDELTTKILRDACYVDEQEEIHFPAGVQTAIMDKVFERMGITEAQTEQKYNENNPNIPKPTRTAYQ